MGRQPSALAILYAVLLLVGCGVAAEDAAQIREGAGPCRLGLNLQIHEQSYFLPLSALPRVTLVLEGVKQEAIPLSELLPELVLEPQSRHGMFTTTQLRRLYDLSFDNGQEGVAPLFISPETAADSFLLVDGRVLYLGDGAPADGPVVREVCRVEALRRMLITRPEPTGTVTRVVHIEDLPTISYVEATTELRAVTFEALLGASGLLGEGETFTQLDYSLVPIDHTGGIELAVRFPWNHAHLEQMCWVPALASTRSFDRVGDLQSSAGVVGYGGVASSGWSSIKQLFEVVMTPAPDAEHIATGPDGACTDPASCIGCHRQGEAIAIPVTCTQCHPR